MAILVTKFRYYKPGSSKARGGYLKYIATRDHVQKIDDSRANFDATDGQKELIKQLLLKIDNKVTSVVPEVLIVRDNVAQIALSILVFKSRFG